jgi:hypothetical protein
MLKLLNPDATLVFLGKADHVIVMCELAVLMVRAVQMRAWILQVGRVIALVEVHFTRT